MTIKMIARAAVFGVLIFLFGEISAYGLEIVMIPVIYYERQGATYVQRTYQKEITADIAARINKYYDVLFDRTPLNDRLAGVTDSDARRVSEYYNVDDILYGTIKDDGNSLLAELKIYNRRRDDYGLFFASDTSNQYERLINTVSDNILEWYYTDRDKVDLLRNELQDLRAEVAAVREDLRRRIRAERDNAREVEKEFALRVPVRVGYWSYVDRLWVELAQGTVEATLGIDMYPELQFSPPFGILNEISWGLNIGYRNGVTGNRGEVLLNGMIINPVMGYHLNFYTDNWLSLGAGMFYELDFWEIEDPEQAKTLSYQQSLTGYSISLDYAYRINARYTVNLGVNLYGYFSSGSALVVKSYLGTLITIYRRAK